MKKFDFEEDYEYFDRLFDSLGGINKNIHLFDFRTPIIKRKEFNKIRNDIFYILMEKKGNICELQLNENCTNNAEQVDHLIPLSSNDLNKELRNIKGVNGKKLQPNLMVLIIRKIWFYLVKNVIHLKRIIFLAMNY